MLAECVGEVDTIEVVPALGKNATELLGELGYRNVRVRIGDGYEGWREPCALRRHHPDGRASHGRAPPATRATQAGRATRGSHRPRRTRPGPDH